MSQQRDAVLPCDHLERRDQHTPRRIPVDADVRAVDVHRIFGGAAVDDAAGLDADLAGEIGRQSVAADLAAQAAGDRQVGGVRCILQTQCEQQVLDQNLVGLHVDAANAVDLWTNGGAERPWPRGVFLADIERDAAAARTANAQGDVLKTPVIAALAVVDGDVAVLDTDFVELIAVKARCAHPVETGECCEQRIDAAAGLCRGRRPVLPRNRWRRTRRCQIRRRRRHERTGGRTGGDTDATVLFDQHRQLGIDEAQTFSAQAAEQKRHAGDADFGLGRRRHDLIVAIANDDVEHANRDARAACPFDLGSADLDLVVAGNVVLDGGGQPRRCDVEADRSLAEPPPQQSECAARQQRQNQRHGHEPAGPAVRSDLVGQQAERLAEPVDSPCGNVAARTAQQPLGAMGGFILIVLVMMPVTSGGLGGGLRHARRARCVPRRRARRHAPSARSSAAPPILGYHFPSSNYGRSAAGEFAITMPATVDKTVDLRSIDGPRLLAMARL